LAARGVGRAFFEMQIGNDERALVRPPQRSGELGLEGGARDIEDDRPIEIGGGGHGGRLATGAPHCVALPAREAKQHLRPLVQSRARQPEHSQHHAQGLTSAPPFRIHGIRQRLAFKHELHRRRTI